MISYVSRLSVALILAAALLPIAGADANKLREHGQPVTVADSGMSVTPSRDWNRLDQQVGKKTETWTLDGEQLNDLTFYGGIEPGKPLVRETSKKHDPLPKVGSNMLLVEVPELLEGTYRTQKGIGAFQVTSTEPVKFLGKDGVKFTYEYTDSDLLTRKGEARAAIVNKQLYMITFEGPRLHFYDQTLADFRALVETAKLS